MARVGPLAGRDIDALWAALRPRIIGLGSGGGGQTGAAGPAGPKGVTWRGEWAADTDYNVGDLVYLDTTGGGASELVTYYALTDHTSLAGTPPVPGGNTQWWELGNAYLLIDGSRPMTGDLNCDSNEIDNVLNLNMLGGVGDAVIDLPRVIHMTGDNADDEAKIDGLERVTFNNEPTASQIEQPSRVEWNTGVTAGTSYTAAAGQTSWDTLEDTLVVYVASGPGA